MTLIKSISGIRGTIGGKPGDNLSPLDVVKYAASYGMWLKEKNPSLPSIQVVIGRDARISGAMVQQLVAATLSGLGIEVIDLGLSTTPTVEVLVTEKKAQGGIILTASHNPMEWNALKLLNERGEFISEQDGLRILTLAEQECFEFAPVTALGAITHETQAIQHHIDLILALPLVKKELISQANFRVVIDSVNSSGGIAIPMLLQALGVTQITSLYGEPTGYFPHNPEPLPEHLGEISKTVLEKQAHLGIVVDPDVDRLALVCEDGSMFGEEYTLVAVADYVLKHQKGNTVSNLSSTRALKDVTEKRGGSYAAAAVGEVNVVLKMKETNAVIGGEGNGGIIYPALHYGRDAMVGIALFLSHLAETKLNMTDLKKSYPFYSISKNKIALEAGMSPEPVLAKIQEKYAQAEINTVDGVKIILNDTEWIHLRKSNTEPIIRIYAESTSIEKADELGRRFVEELKALC